MAKTFSSRLCGRLNYFIKDEGKAVKEYPELVRALRRAYPKEDFGSVADIAMDETQHHMILTAIYNAKCRR